MLPGTDTASPQLLVAYYYYTLGDWRRQLIISPHHSHAHYPYKIKHVLIPPSSHCGGIFKPFLPSPSWETVGLCTYVPPPHARGPHFQVVLVPKVFYIALQQYTLARHLTLCSSVHKGKTWLADATDGRSHIETDVTVECNSQ